MAGGLAFAGRLPRAVAQTIESPVFTFVSMPDFLNADIGDVRQAIGWRRGDPNSINASYRQAIDVILDAVQAESPHAVFVAGDLVEGHWGTDDSKTGIFGPVGTYAQKLAALERAADLYYGQWKERFAIRGLPVYPAVGDHEIGDNNWYPGTFKWNAFPTFKRVWAKHFRRGESHPEGAFNGTAYAKHLTPDILLVTVDVFSQVDNKVVAQVRGKQLDWLDSVLSSTTAKHVIVQGHTPVLGPVLQYRSSGLMLNNGTNSAFWKTMVRHGVDLYLCGEVHDVTVLERDGVTQIAHGSLIAGGRMNYLVGRVYADRMDLEIKRIDGTRDESGKLWQTSTKRPPIGVTYQPGTYPVHAQSIPIA